MPFAPFVIVTSTTEIVRGTSRVRVNEPYTTALTSVGLIPLVLPPIEASQAVATLTDVSGLLLTGGEDIDPARFGQDAHAATGTPHPARDTYEIALARAAFELRIPTLAICRGAQVMNVALGGTLVQDIASQHPGTIAHDPGRDRRNDRVHEVEVEPESRLAAIVRATRIATNSSHHQSLDDVADGLRVVARTNDGIIEAVEATDPAWWMVAVQWHPEELTATPEDWDRRLFAAFAHAARDGGDD